MICNKIVDKIIELFNITNFRKTMLLNLKQVEKYRKDRYSLIFTYQPASDNSHHRSGPAELIEKEKVINY